MKNENELIGTNWFNQSLRIENYYPFRLAGWKTLKDKAGQNHLRDSVPGLQEKKEDQQETAKEKPKTFTET